MAEFSCPVTGCKYVVNGMNKEDVLARMARHRKEAHGGKEMIRDMASRLRRHNEK